MVSAGDGSLGPRPSPLSLMFLVASRCAALGGTLLHFLPFYLSCALVKPPLSEWKFLLLVIKAFSHRSDNKLMNAFCYFLNQSLHLCCLFWTSHYAFVVLLLGNDSLAVFTCYLFSVLDCFIMNPSISSFLNNEWKIVLNSLFDHSWYSMSPKVYFIAFITTIIKCCHSSAFSLVSLFEKMNWLCFLSMAVVIWTVFSHCDITGKFTILILLLIILTFENKRLL